MKNDYYHALNTWLVKIAQINTNANGRLNTDINN